MTTCSAAVAGRAGDRASWTRHTSGVRSVLLLGLALQAVALVPAILAFGLAMLALIARTALALRHAFAATTPVANPAKRP